MTRDDDEPEDSSWLQDHDWLELNKLLRAYKDGGDEAIKKAFRDLLEKDALCPRGMCVQPKSHATTV